MSDQIAGVVAVFPSPLEVTVGTVHDQLRDSVMSWNFVCFHSLWELCCPADTEKDFNMNGRRSKVDPFSRHMSRHASFLREVQKNVTSEVGRIPYSEIVRVKLRKFFGGSTFGTIYAYALLVFCIVSCGQGIYQTYLDPELDRKLLNKLAILELNLASLFAFDWGINLFLADHRWNHFWGFFSIIDLLTVIPIWFNYFIFTDRVVYSGIQTPWEGVNYAMHAASSLLILRILRLHKRLLHIEDEVQRHLSQFTLTVVAITLFATAAMQYFEADVDNENYHTWLYFMIVSMTTVGYGDVAPKTTLGRALAVCSLCLLIIWVPDQITQLIEKMNRSSVYARSRYKPSPNSRHIVVCGDMSSVLLAEFFNELFHEDHDRLNLCAVVLHPSYPSDAMYEILINPVFGYFVTYLDGSPLQDKDLARACAEKAIAVFVMANKFSSNPDDEDAKTILQYTSIRRHVSLLGRVERPMFGMQLIRSENRRHVVLDDPCGDKELVLCLHEIKMGLMAKTCMFPGSSTLICNLLSSFSDDKEKQVEKKRPESAGDDDQEKTWIPDGENRRRSSEERVAGDGWLEEYSAGCTWEIYTTKLAKVFCGVPFKDVAQLLYTRLGVVLFGLRIRELLGNHKAFVVLNPADYVVPLFHRYSVEGFVIARNKASSDLSTKALHIDRGQTFAEMVRNGRRTADPSPKSVRRGGQSMVQQTVLSKRHGVYEVKRGDAVTDCLQDEVTTHGTADSQTSDVTQIANMPKSKNDLLGEPPKLSNMLQTASTVTVGTPTSAATKWKTLFARANLSAEDTISPEELHRLEDARMQEEFFVLSSPLDLQDVTVRTSMENEYAHIKKLMLLISRDVHNIHDFVYHFRQKNLGKLTHIVILSPDDIPHNVWSKICLFEGIYIVRGSPNQVRDLRRAGIFRASEVVIIADPPTDMQKGQSTGIDAMVDADAIFTYHLVKKLNEKAHIVVELVRTENVRYLDTRTITESEDLTVNYHTTPAFASGTLFVSSVVDTIIPQAFYNPHLLVILNKLLNPIGTEDSIQFSEASLYGVDQVPSSSLYQTAIPDDLDEPRTYGALFSYLSQRGIIAIGLYRGMFANMIGSKNNRLPYVFCNPPADAPVYSCDRVFVLSLSAPRCTAQDVVQAAVDVSTSRRRTIQMTPHDKNVIVKKSHSSISMDGLAPSPWQGVEFSDKIDSSLSSLKKLQRMLTDEEGLQKLADAMCIIESMKCPENGEGTFVDERRHVWRD